MIAQHAQDEAVTRNTAYAQGVLNLVGATLSLWIWQDLANSELGLWQGLTLASGGLTLVALRAFPKGWTPRVGSFLFLANLVPMFVMIWTAHAARAKLAGFWVPFQVHKLSAVTLAILAPVELWAGLAGILGLFVLALVQYQTFPVSALEWIPKEEPGATVAFSSFAVILLFYRLRGRKRAREVMLAHEQARMLQRSARLIFALRDLVNSPVQSLNIDAQLIRTKHPDLAPVADRIERSVQSLAQVNTLVAKQAETLAPHLSEASFDAHEIVRNFGLHPD